jgi:phosphohistidine phosphatase
MPRDLLILRHAKSDWSTSATRDFERPLAKRGRNDAPRMGEWLAREGLVPGAIVSSPAERARETTLLVCKSVGFKLKKVFWEDAVYAANLSELLGVLAGCPADAASVMLVGHNPGLEDLVDFLADGVEEPADGKLLPTAALARLEMPEDWGHLKSGCARLLSITRPRDLGD